ncbi:uncharacterized protein involved in exopolysaccharide biosynthesis [Caulobacter ginsengisoli]|uniref:Uncharacterized protein involved in exopolysaccharide biosynthesis n=1 Tax=Caulobacter ginsengisoli TaxID=400775 RepID=A0ABU0IQ37_9CAUL|nr:GumC family protein [Caulobacter ginsengisoli]MDQ0464124.1 uncharacterized protein involved in exopolysaccharide biosynthesis [Caulobacter ginsengisoli]
MVAHDPPASADWAARPRYAPSDFITLLWRERYLMISVFLLIFIAGLGFAFTLKKAYPAHSSLLIQLGQEYVYEPLAGDAARGAVPDVNSVVQSETAILSSEPLREMTIRKVGLGIIYPDLAAKYDAASVQEKQAIMAKAVEGMGKGLKIEAAPDNPVVNLTFEHEDPVVAARVLNTLLEQYLLYRRSVLAQPSSTALDRQRVMFQGKLDEADAAYQQFLVTNDIGDFNAQKTSLTQLQAQAEAQSNAVQAQLQDRQGRLAALQQQMAGVQPEIGLYRDTDTTASAKLAALKLEREDKLGRYLPDSQTIKDIDAQIAQLEQGVQAGRTLTEGPKRYGVNPVYQTAQTEQIQLTAEVAALRQSKAEYDRQVQEANDRLLKLVALEPQFQALSRDRDLLQTNVRDYSVKATQDEAVRQIASESSDNIRIVERASAPSTGKSLRKPVMILALLFAGFAALCAGLVRMFLRPGLPTAASASRTLDLPILGMASVKPR